jgi:signal transduction histidine kinase
LSERDLHRRVDIAVPDDELGELVRTFNAMLGRLEASFTSMNGFIADASHELRGPLTKMRSEIDLAIDRPGSQEDLKRVLSVVQSETAHLTDLVDKLLLLARADAGVLRPSRSPLDVADFTHEVGSRWLSVAQGRGLRLEVEAPDSGIVIADPTLTRRVLDNLLENAIRHSSGMGTIWLRATKDHDDWLFEVADEGPGVPLAHRQRIFDRFARVDSSRARSDLGGTGLGLAVSMTLARVQEAELVLLERNGTGAVFQLRFPKSQGTNGKSKERTSLF